MNLEYLLHRRHARSDNHFLYGHRCYAFSTEGIVSYSPQRSKKDEGFRCIIEVDKELTRYYREQFKKQFGIILYAPAFDAHLTVLRGLSEYTPKMQESWEYLEKKTSEIWYDSNLYWNEQHVWLNTYCDEYFDIRKYYEVPKWNSKDFGHITIGKFFP